MARFTAGEMEVMRILWEHGELKPAEIQKHFPRPIKNAALRSYLTILVEKGHLVRRGKGKAFYYRPKTKRESTFRSMLGELVNTFCGGSSEALLCHLLAKEKLSPEELLELQRMAQEQPASTRRILRFPQENQVVNALLMASRGLQSIVGRPGLGRAAVEDDRDPVGRVAGPPGARAGQSSLAGLLVARDGGRPDRPAGGRLAAFRPWKSACNSRRPARRQPASPTASRCFCRPIGNGAGGARSGLSDDWPDSPAARPEAHSSPVGPSESSDEIARLAGTAAQNALPPLPAGSQNRFPVSLPTLLLAVWLGGIAVLVFRLSLGHYRIRRMVRRAARPPQWIRGECLRVAQAIGCRGRVEVLQSRGQSSRRFSAGSRRPLLLLPARMCDDSYRQRLAGHFRPRTDARALARRSLECRTAADFDRALVPSAGVADAQGPSGGLRVGLRRGFGEFRRRRGRLLPDAGPGGRRCLSHRFPRPESPWPEPPPSAAG